MSSAPSTSLEVDDVAFGYSGGDDVLTGASLTWSGPGVLCLLGANGAGKSTLLRLCTGELTPSRGVVRVAGRPVAEYGPRRLARVLAYIPQHHVPTFDYTVLDIATMGRAAHLGLLAAPGHADRQIALAQLDRLGIAELADRPYTAVSGGQRQLVLIASALAQEPELLLLDEPTAPLDLGNQQRFLTLVRSLADSGIGVVMTTHAPDHPLALGGTTALVDRGGVTDVGPSDRVVTTESMTRLYGTPVHVVTTHGRRICIPGELA